MRPTLPHQVSPWGAKVPVKRRWCDFLAPAKGAGAAPLWKTPPRAANSVPGTFRPPSSPPIRPRNEPIRPGPDFYELFAKFLRNFYAATRRLVLRFPGRTFAAPQGTRPREHSAPPDRRSYARKTIEPPRPYNLTKCHSLATANAADGQIDRLGFRPLRSVLWLREKPTKDPPRSAVACPCNLPNRPIA